MDLEAAAYEDVLNVGDKDGPLLKVWDAMPAQENVVSVDITCGVNQAALRKNDSSAVATAAIDAVVVEPTPKARKPARRSRLASRARGKLRKRTKGLVSSFTKSLTGLKIDEDAACEEERDESEKLHQSAPDVSAAQAAAQLVANEFKVEEDLDRLAEDSCGDEGKGELSRRKSQERVHHSVAGPVSAAQAARLVASEFFKEEGPSLSDEEEDLRSLISECCHSDPPSEESIAREVGMSAHQYLEECFYAEVSVLDREKFNAIPEIAKSDFTITGHLGKGSFSDVFEVVLKGGGPLLDATQSHITIQKGGRAFDATRSDRGHKGPRRPSARRRRASFSTSINTATLTKPSCGDQQLVLAMKCLRPQIRSDTDQFTLGAEDLVHETAILATLKHQNIIKLHGRASGCLKNAFVLNDGYFLLLDKLNETLQERLDSWKPKLFLQGIAARQIDVARSIADALSYLHSKKIVFRDLKPANVGFDAHGTLKLFDFGFAIGIPEPDNDNPTGLLWDRCGTPRYMAPEVGNCEGYGLEADVYSFGILLWEICALTKPFSSFASCDQFEEEVFTGGRRPSLKNHWPTRLREFMAVCWSAAISERPAMTDVEAALVSVLAGKRKSKLGAVKSSLYHRSASAPWY